MFSEQTKLFGNLRPEDLVTELINFTHNGDVTKIEDRNGVTFLINEFWTAKQRQGHSIHEISYRACFKPQLPEFFISRLTCPGDTVYDPFMGRGTTPVQSVLMGRNAIGNDINPLSTLLTRPRTNVPTIQEISKRLSNIDWSYNIRGHEELLVFYHQNTLQEILALRNYLIEREKNGAIDRVDDWIRMVAINRLTGHSTGFFSVYSLPPNQAVSIEAQRKINEKRKQIPDYRNVEKIIIKKSKSLLRDSGIRVNSTAQFIVGPAEKTPIQDFSVDLVVTSPPFLDIVQYASDNWLRCWFAGIDALNVPISMHKKPEDWQFFIKNVFTDLARIVKPGGHVCFEVGEVRNGKVELEQLVLKSVSSLPFSPICVVINDQEFTKTANCWGIENNSKGTNTNRIVILKRL